MYLEIAQLTVKEGDEDAFARRVCAAAPLMEAAPGCISFELVRSVESPQNFRMLIKWASIPDHLAFRENPNATMFGAILADHVVDKSSDHNTRLYPSAYA